MLIHSTFKKKVCIFAATLVAVFYFIGLKSHTSALELNNECKQVELIFANGSGSDPGEPIANSFFNKSVEKINKLNFDVNIYEVGTDVYAGKKYPAEDIDSFKNKLGAEFFWGSWVGSKYRDSVKDGVTEAKSYLTQRMSKCQDSIFVVGGFSQGSQVIGEALNQLSLAQRSRIVYASFLADPKLYLPEGDVFIRDLCKGGLTSTWRRGNVSCTTKEGILEARKPYVKDNLIVSSGSWCNKKDPVCTNILTNTFNSTHSQQKYIDLGYVNQAAKEIADAVKKRLVSPGGPIYPAFARTSTHISTVSNFVVSSQSILNIPNDESVVVIPTLDELYAKPGEELTFDISRTYHEDDYGFMEYKWDFDGDGIVDQTTTTTQATHVYESEFEGTATVRAYLGSGQSNMAEFTVHVSQEGIDDKLPSAVASIQVAQPEFVTGTKNVSLNWNASVNAEGYAVYVDEVIIGYTDETSLILKDITNDTAHTFGVAGYNSLSASSVVAVSIPFQPAPPIVVEPPQQPAQTKVCKALVKLKPYIHPLLYKVLWKAAHC